MNEAEKAPSFGQELLLINTIKEAVQTVVFGQDVLVDRLLIALLCNQHVLIEGAPGLAKTLLITTLARTLGCKFNRIQFTPDLLPADLMGTLIYNPAKAEFVTKKGPIFSQLILADEINRAPAKVQSALLEAMQERQVTIGEHTYPLAPPFMVMATQNPIDQEGTYPLPEAQMDRFMMKLKINYPSRETELRILRHRKDSLVPQDKEIPQIADPKAVIALRRVVHSVFMSEIIEEYLVDLVQATRMPEKYNMAHLKEFIRYGASPRASIFLAMACRAHALLNQRTYVIPADVKEVWLDVLRHRLIPGYEAEMEDRNAEDILLEIIQTLPAP